jgi:lysine 2,3-aminomutase
METWQRVLHDSITTPEELRKHIACDSTALGEVIANFPMRINPYFLKLIQSADDPLGKQAIPCSKEIKDFTCMADPLGEDSRSPVPNLVHKYPDRALLLVSSQCAMYCRFCTRKRKVGTEKLHVTEETLQAGYEYLRKTPAIREVLISGGDPFLLPDKKINAILTNLRSIPSIEIIRIGTRVPSVLPMRITENLVRILRKFHPLFINTHFNHPAEITPESAKACSLLADGGIPLGCQTVLLKGINDNARTLKRLFLALLKLRVKPYYLFQADLTRGTDHFRTRTEVGIRIMRKLYGHVSGMAIPTFALDGPGGKGKIPLTPQYIIDNGETLTFENYLGEICTYPESGDGI